ncbi:adaptin ear-binding coat-associated protein 1 [Flagelloscypha sp. PMI_526]|nr:adaptin ear-binding coat-associated protein 1 [Flagelloscypha sp. PMI_526]
MSESFSLNMDEEIESILYICREVSVYKIPPLKKNEGHRAGEWGDLADPLWKGRLRITEKSTGAAMLLEDNSTGELFARAEYDPARPSIEAVLDSSRYFVVRIENEGKKAYIGMGFAERGDSFDFNVAIQDYTKRWKVKMNPPEEEEEAAPVSTGPKKDYSLKEGQTFSISIPGRSKPKPSTTTGDLFGDSTSSSSSSGLGGFSGLLPPPPSAPKRT